MQSSLCRRATSLIVRAARGDLPSCRRAFLGRSFQVQFDVSRCTRFHRSPAASSLKFSWTRERLYSSQFNDIVFPDPHRHDLYYHFVNPPTPISKVFPAFALSFLSAEPPAVDAATVIGWLPAKTYTTDTPEPSGVESGRPRETSAGLHDFVVNPKFIALLHEIIKSGLEEGVDDIWINGAIQLQEGWMHIHDQRNIPALGRIGDPDDIIASVLVEDSKIKPETYQPMPSYRVCTSDGILQLTPGLARHLLYALVRLTKEGASS